MIEFAFLLDLWIGDPVYALHPIRLIGRLIERGESFLRRACSKEKIAGGILALALPAAIFVLSGTLIWMLGRIHPGLSWLASLFGIYSSISVKDLKKEVLTIYAALSQGDLEKARHQLSRIVGRDTESLKSKEIVQATIETVADSTVDGIIAPLFYAALGGAPLALAYKTVNTLDSMIAHTSKRYLDFGFVAAKQDELWNWLPARLSYYLIALAAFFTTGRTQEALFTGWQDGVSASYSVSSIPEATFAGALGVHLGGKRIYSGEVVEKPLLGFPKKDFDREDISKSLEIMTAASFIFFIGLLVLKYILRCPVPILKF